LLWSASGPAEEQARSMATSNQRPGNQLWNEEHSASSSGDESWGFGKEGSPEEYYGKGPIAGAPPYVRRDFVRKVYGILTVQLIFTVAIAAPFNLFLTPDWVRSHMSLYYLATFGSLGLIVGIACCCQQAARTFPTNYVFLLLVTVCEAVIVGFITVFYTTQSVLLAVAATVVVFSGLTFYACFTKTDFTGLGPYLMAALFGLMGFGLVLMVFSFFAPVPPWLHSLMALCGVLLFSFYIIYDTQLIIGGTHTKNQFSIDDYAFAALNLYLDVINLFLYILQIFGDRR